jgi:hypothetical protein
MAGQGEAVMSRELTKEEQEEWRRNHRSTEERAMERMFSGGHPEGLPSDQLGTAGQIVRAQLPIDQRERLDRQIADCMRGAIDDALHRRNPMSGPSLPTVTPAGAGRVVSGPVERGTGWRTSPPLEVPGGSTAQAVILAMTEAALPHGQSNPAYRGPKKAKE